MAGPCQCPGPFVCQVSVDAEVLANLQVAGSWSTSCSHTISRSLSPSWLWGVSWSWDAHRLWRIPADGNAVWWLSCPNMMMSGFGGVPGTGFYGDSQSWSKPTTPAESRPRPSTRGGSRKGDGPPDPDDDGDDEGGSTSRDETRSSTAATSEIRSMLRRKHYRDGNDSRPKSSLGSVKIEEYYGDRSRYIKWKRAIEAQQHLYALNEGFPC